ncbi:MAG TPA: hypothetical protein VIV40_13565 [Kofleriaceae bacterium]
MKIPAILAALVVTTVTAAAAPKLESVQPKLESVEPRHTESTARLSLQDKKKKKAPKVAKVRQPGDWFEVGDATPAKFGTVFFVVGDDAKSVSKLRIDAVTGKVLVRRIAIYFDDGSTRILALNKTLDTKRAKSTFVDLGGIKTIDRVVVTTDAYVNGEYAIFGSALVATPPCC